MEQCAASDLALYCLSTLKATANSTLTTVVPRPLSNDPRFTQCVYRYSRASKRFVKVYMLGFENVDGLC